MPRTNPTTTPCSVNGCEKAAAAPDWTEAEVAVLMAAKLTDHRKRYSGPDPDESLVAVAVKLGRSEVACRCKRRRVEHERGHRTGDQWTVGGAMDGGGRRDCPGSHGAGRRARGRVDVASRGRSDRPDATRHTSPSAQFAMPGSKRWIKIRYGGTATRGNK